MKRMACFSLLVIAAIGASAATIVAQSSACSPTGGLNFICGLQAPEDLVLVPNTRWLIASGMSAGSGLHLIDTQAKTARTLFGAGVAGARADKAKFATCSGPLDPKQAILHGLSLRPAQAGRYTLYATNHGGRESIEVFDLDASGAAPVATWIGCVLMPNGWAANSVAVSTTAQSSRRCSCCPGRLSRMYGPDATQALSSCGRRDRRNSGRSQEPNYRETTASKLLQTIVSSTSHRSA